MSIIHLLEDFAEITALPSNNAQKAEDAELLDSFEQGYKAGWEDAVRAKSEEKAHVSSELARNLQDLSFTYHEAHTAILAELAPVMEQAVMAAVPEIARASFGTHIATELSRLTSQGDDGAIVISVAADDLNAVSDIIPDQTWPKLEIVSDSALSPGQAHLSFSGKERQIDINEIVETVRQAFSGFVQQAREESNHDGE